MRQCRFIAALAALVFLVSCTTFPGNARLENASTAPSSSIRGLLDSNAGTLNIVLVHGMGNTSEDYWRHLFTYAPEDVARAFAAAETETYVVRYTREFALRGEAYNCGQQACAP